MSETQGAVTAELSSSAPVTSDDIAAVYSAADAPAPAGADSSPAPPSASVSDAPPTVESEPEGSPPEQAGPLPFERHKAILERARAEAKAAAEQEWKGKFGWAEAYQPDQVKQAVQLAQLLEQDPQRAVAMIQAALASQQPTGPTPEEPPAPDLRAEDGTAVYSAPQLQKLLDWQRRQLQTEIDSRYGPIRERVQYQEMAQRAEHEATSILQRARAEWPLFPDLEADIKAKMVADARLQLHDAYLSAYREKGLKLQEEQWRAAYEGTVQKKAVAASATTSRPAGRKPVPLHERDIRDLVEEEYSRLSRG